MGIWKTLSNQKKAELLRRRYINNEDIYSLASDVGMNSLTLDRRLRELRAVNDVQDSDWRQADAPAKVTEPVITFPQEKPLPTNQELFDILRKGPVSLGELSRKFDRSEATVLDMVGGMEAAGYVIERKRHTVEVNTREAPKVEFAPARTLADEVGHEIVFGLASDSHFGSSQAQVSARNAFIRIAYEEYGVRHIFDPGDLTTGVNGYRGQEFDMIPSLRPRNAKDFARVTEGEIWLADQCTPKLPGLRYYEMGGNHDYWHVVNSGIDAVARYCRMRDDSIFLGYDVADVPLTDRVSLRLWHPSGGVPYSVSYRLQKGLEQLAFEELTRAIEENDNPKVRFLMAGHLHVEVKLHRGPMVAAHVGCFEGQTNYLKRKGLYPTIGGAIFKVRVTDAGLIQRVEYTFLPFNEIANDFMNWPQPEEYVVMDEPDNVETLFSTY